MTFAKFDDYVRARSAQYVDELKELVRMPTVSAHGSAIPETAEVVLARAKKAGIAAEALRVDGGPPTIVGETGRGERTLLVYDHYDVQPPDPLDEWKTPPFEPTERDGLLFARASTTSAVSGIAEPCADTVGMRTSSFSSSTYCAERART